MNKIKIRYCINNHMINFFKVILLKNNRAIDVSYSNEFGECLFNVNSDCYTINIVSLESSDCCCSSIIVSDDYTYNFCFNTNKLITFKLIDNFNIPIEKGSIYLWQNHIL